MNGGAEALFIIPADLIGAATVAALLGVDKSTVTRRVQAGTIPVLAQLDGPGGAYVFNAPDIAALAAAEAARPATASIPTIKKGPPEA